MVLNNCFATFGNCLKAFSKIENMDYKEAINFFEFILEKNDEYKISNFANFIVIVNEMDQDGVKSKFSLSKANINSLIKTMQEFHITNFDCLNVFLSFYRTFIHLYPSINSEIVLRNEKLIKSFEKIDCITSIYADFNVIRNKSKQLSKPSFPRFDLQLEIISSSTFSEPSYSFPKIGFCLENGQKHKASCGSFFINSIANALFLYPDNGKDLYDSITFYYEDIYKKFGIDKSQSIYFNHLKIHDPNFMPFTPFLRTRKERGRNLLLNPIRSKEANGVHKIPNSIQSKSPIKEIEKGEDIIEDFKPIDDTLYTSDVHKIPNSIQSKSPINEIEKDEDIIEDFKPIDDSSPYDQIKAPYYSETYKHLMNIFVEYLQKEGLPNFDPNKKEGSKNDIYSDFYYEMIEEAQKVIDIKFMSELNEVRNYFINYLYKNEKSIQKIKELFLKSVNKSLDFFIKSREEYYNYLSS